MGLPRVTVLISGSGSNLQALINACSQGVLKVELVRVISSSKKAYGLERASASGIDSTTHSLFEYTRGISKEDKAKRSEARARFEEDLAELVLKDAPDLIVCAGWLLVLGPGFLQRLKSIPIINLHPALPGAFDGTTHAIELAWKQCQETGRKMVAGCMVHYVIEEVDKGKALIVKKLELHPGQETLEEYEERVHQAEHVAIVEGVIKALEQRKCHE